MPKFIRTYDKKHILEGVTHDIGKLLCNSMTKTTYSLALIMV